tara:strand:+ start:121993 stop:124161 length:2169 start_codon:yes stop_codon:yes gene_type:complete
MSKSSDDYMDDILNELNEGLPQPEASDVSSSKDSNDSKGDKEKSDANSESGADDWFADVSFDDDEPYPNDTGSDSKDDAPTGGSVPSMPNDEFSVSLDDDSISSDGFDDSVLDADPSVSPSVEEPESVITQDDIDDGFSDSLLLDEEQVENESLEEVADTSTTVDNGNPASESVMPPDEEKDVDDIFGESMFNDDDEDALNDDAPHENVAVDNSANLTASDETPDHEDDFGGMVDLSDEDGLYGNMIGDEDGEDHNGAVEDLSMVDIIDDEDDEEQANLTRDENAVSAFSQGVDSADVDSVADEDLDSLQQMESTLESLDSIADNDFIQPVEAEDVAPPKPDMATTALGEKDAEENNVVDNSDGKPAKNDAKENKPTVKSDAASGGPSSIRIISSAVAISVMLSLGTVAGGVYSGLLSFTGGAPGKQSVIDSSARDSISAIRAELDEIKASNSDVMRRQEVALAEFKSTVGKLEEEQRNVSRLTKQIKEGAASYEKLMIARLEKQLELMLSLSEKQSSQSQSITDQVMREVESYLKNAEQASESNIKPLLGELSDAVARIGKIEARVREQAQLISMVENESDYVKALVEKAEQRLAQPQPETQNQRPPESKPQVKVESAVAPVYEKPIVRTTPKVEEKPSIPPLWLTAVFENRENGVLRYELFIQTESERGTPHSTPYIFSNGRVTVIPGYGRILRVESIEGGVDDINYQVVTENGIIKGAP